MEVGLWMLAAAGVFDFVGFGKRQWANRVAAVLALAGFVRVLAPSHIGALLRGWAADGFRMLGGLVGQADPQWGHLIGSVGLSVVATGLILLWFFRLLPSSTPQGGEAVAKELDSKWIWGGAAVCSLFVSLIPGRFGEFFVAVTGWGAGIASTATEHAVTMHSVLSVAGVA